MQASVRVFYCNHPWMLQIKTTNLSFEIEIIKKFQVGVNGIRQDV